MMIDFSKEDIKEIYDIIDNYKTISSKISEHKKEMEDIQMKVNELTNEMNNISNKEKDLMTKLHKKYGNFCLQDIYDALNL